jgi:hypothetical protein
MSVEWQPPSSLPDLRCISVIALDSETKDNGIQAERGPSWPWGDGYVCGLSLAWRENGAIRALLFVTTS